MKSYIPPTSKLEKYDRRFIFKISTGIILALGAIFASQVVGFMIQSSQIAREQDTSSVVSASANQRMLSQRLALLSLALVNVQSEVIREKTKKAFETEIQEMETTHLRLISGDPAHNIPFEKSDKIRELFFVEPASLDRKVRDFIATARAISTNNDMVLMADNPNLHSLTEMSTELSRLFERLTDQYRTEGVEGVLGLERLALQLLIVQLGLIVLAAFFIFYRLVRRLKIEFHERSSAQIELVEQNKELEQFAAIVAHDLKAPLNNIGGVSQYLRSKFANEADKDTHEILDLMLAGVKRMTEMIDELMQYALLTRKQRNLEQVSLNDVVKKVILDFDQKIKQDHAKLIVESLPTIVGDRVQMEHLFQNLISNALKYRHPDREPQISIKANSSHLDERMVSVVIEDNGRGFPLGSEEWMFEPFRRLNPKEAVEGSGFGLALCRKIVKRHNGLIRAEHVENGGARFIVTLMG